MARRLSLRTKLVAGVAAVALTGAGVFAWQVTHRDPPSFRRGGEFATGEVSSTPSSSATTATTAAAPAGEAAEGATSSTAAPPPGTARPPATAAPGTTAPPATTPTTRSRRSTSGGGRPGATAPSPPPTSAPSPAPAPPPEPEVPAGPRLPAFGVYTYAVDGTEAASIMGSRRFPSQMRMTAHGAPDLGPEQVVFDLHYSDEHEERQIVSYRDDGIYFDFEGGSVTFGPRTETSEADYDPPMLQIPRPLSAGFTTSGTSRARSADGSAGRTEQWKIAVVGQERMTVAGSAVDTWKVEVDRSFSGSGEQGTRHRTYWFDPGRNLWVKYREIFHGERRTGGFTFTYDADLTATLTGFSPA